MKIPEFTAQTSLYRTSNHYCSAVAESGGSILDQSVVAAYIPGPDTQNRCSGCTGVCVTTRDVCLAKTAATVVEACWISLGFGCAEAIALGYLQAASCEQAYLECFGICNIPTGPGWESPCCPKVCGAPTPGVAGSGCCDHGESCVDPSEPNSRQGCCPSGRRCGDHCCATGEICNGDTCCPPGTNTTCNGVCCNGVCDSFGSCCEPPSHVCGGQCCPPFNKCCNGKCCGAYQQCDPTLGTCSDPPPPPDSGCYLFAGGSPCGTGRKCCYDFLKCCGVDDNGLPICKTNCIH